MLFSIGLYRMTSADCPGNNLLLAAHIVLLVHLRCWHFVECKFSGSPSPGLTALPESKTLLLLSRQATFLICLSLL